MTTPLQMLLVMIAGWVNEHRRCVIACLQEDNRVLRELHGKKRLRFNDDQRRRLAARGKALGRRLMGEIGTLVTPDTILRRHRESIARKYDGSAARRPGRPSVAREIRELVVRMASDNEGWGYTRIVGWVLEQDALATSATPTTSIDVWLLGVGRTILVGGTTAPFLRPDTPVDTPVDASVDQSVSLRSPAGLPAPRDEAVDAAVAFLEALFAPPRRFDIRLWDGTILSGGGGAAPLTLVVASRPSLTRAFRPPLEMSLGEAFLRGDLELEGDICAAGEVIDACRAALRRPADLVRLARRWLDLPRAAGPAPAIGYAPADLAGADRTRARDRSAIRYHYDVGNDFYGLFLDRRMVYSCAYYPTGAEDLDEAQERKLEHICRKLRLRSGERLLDIGCGWGGLLIYAAERYGVLGVGVTLAEEQRSLAQARIAQAGLADRVVVRSQDYRDIADGPFDKIVSVGMFEHVGRKRLPEYFAAVHGLLQPGGLFLNHGISQRVSPAGGGSRAMVGRALGALIVGRYAFRKRYIFPIGSVAPVSEGNLAAERAGFEVHDVENLRPHYARTLQHWVRRLEARREDAERIGGVTMYRLWRLQLGVASYQFASGHQALHQTLLGKSGGATSGLPLSRADLYP